MTSHASSDVLDGLLIDDVASATFRIDRRVFTDPDVLQAEREKIFDQCWLYVGHESEIPERGSFLARKVAGRPMIFVRDGEGQVRLFFDACTHRGNALCREKRGRANRFTCFYHGWTFNTAGKLIGVPDGAGYGDMLDRAGLGLRSPPRMDSYRGMVFMSMKPDIVDLRTYLGDAAAYIDVMLDMTDSEPVIATGQQSYGMKANWKLLLENSADAYHGMFTHMRFFGEFLPDMGVDVESWRQVGAQDADRKVIAFDYGHAVIDTPAGPLPLFVERPEVYRQLREGLVRKYGERRADALLSRSQNLLIFPNLVLISAWRTIRTFYPVSPGELECSGWAIVGRDDPPELREARFGNFISFLGPGGFGTPDDVEALENCQRNFAGSDPGWSDISKGMAREGGSVANDELQMRTVWRRWYAMLNPRYVPGVEQGGEMTLAAE